MTKVDLEALNPQQHQAVTAPPANSLILAGAGSGKTRVLTQRIAWLIQTQGYSPQQILAVTFTNKAAAEMRARIETLLQMNLRYMWVGTFHSTAHRLLRLHWQEAGLSQTFQIMDAEDQQRMIRRLIKSLNLDEQQWSSKVVQHFINEQKDKGIRAYQYATDGDYFKTTMQRIYDLYERQCAQNHLLDFSELLLRAYELCRDNQVLAQHYQKQFKYILIDEFQDTNVIQYKWIKQLTCTDNHIMIVGDDDQSIYGWRGAQVENIRRFSLDFADAQILRLEQNYRSTNIILKAANTLIANNQKRMGKDLWSSKQEGQPILLYNAFNEIDEAKFVAARIIDWIEQGGLKKETAILYRSNAQSRVIEEALLQANLPYRVYGGLRFFERAEIKDALAYLRLIANHDDDAAFERVVNHPPRGIGAKTLTLLRTLAQQLSISMWQAAERAIAEGQLTARATQSLHDLLQWLDELAGKRSQLSLDELTEIVLQKSHLTHHYQTTSGEKALAKVENLNELVTAAKQFELTSEEEGDRLSTFLSHAAMEAGELQGEVHQDCVQLMTLHSAKGLEFPLVFMVGMEEGLFPHQLAAEEPGRLEEERRLCYVGMTRAMQQLYFCYAEVRLQHGQEHYHRVSRFVREIPAEYIEEVRQPSKMYRPKLAQQLVNHGHDLQLGQFVFHQAFGEGVVLRFEGRGAHARVEVKFKQSGTKWLVLAYAKLQAL